MLTRKQYDLLLFIDRHLREHGVSPSFDEMKDALDLRSKSGIHRLITGLEERGFIRRLAHRARALEVLKLPENMDQSRQQEHATLRAIQTSAATNVIRGVFHERADREAPEAESITLPLYGQIAAGTPIEALRDPSQTCAVPAAMVGRGEHYALTVAGDSMEEAGILDGDTVIIRRTETAENGDIVVALVDGMEVTLKRLRRKGQSIALEPANSRHKTRIFGPDRVHVQGRLVGLVRQY